MNSRTVLYSLIALALTGCGSDEAPQQQAPIAAPPQVVQVPVAAPAPQIIQAPAPSNGLVDTLAGMALVNSLSNALAPQSSTTRIVEKHYITEPAAPIAPSRPLYTPIYRPVPPPIAPAPKPVIASTPSYIAPVRATAVPSASSGTRYYSKPKSAGVRYKSGK